MNTNHYRRFLLGLLCVAGLTVLPTASVAQTEDEMLETVRDTLRTDRKAAVEKAMQFTADEAKAFWPAYDAYRAEMDKVGEKIKTLVVAYSAAYPEVTTENARNGLKEMMALEKQVAAIRATHLAKIGKAISPVKTLRFAQVDMRLDVANRLALATQIPLVPIEGKIGLKTSVDKYATGSKPGAIEVTTIELKATVLAVEKASRSLTLLGKDGIRETVTVGPDVVNFNEIKVGDEILLVLSDSLVVQMGDSVAGERPEEVVNLAPVGAKPGGVVAKTTEMIATIVAIDAANRTATLKFEDGTEDTFPVRAGVDLSKRKVGEKIVIRKTEAVALRITKG